MDNKKINFFKRIKLAIFNVEKYQEFALEKPNIALKYFIKLILVLAIIISLSAVYKFASMSEFFIDAFKNDFPEFTFSENTLVADEVTNTVREGKQIELSMIVDTTIESTDQKVNEYIIELNKHENGVIFLKDRVIIQLEGLVTQSNFSYADLNVNGLGEITKQSILETLENTNMSIIYIAFFISIALYMFMLYLISTAIEAVLIGIIGFFTAKIVRLNMKFTQTLSMSVYAITLSVLLNAIYTPIRLLTGFNIEYFSIMYTLIPYIYIITAILMIRSELIKQQIEIGKIEKVQKEVKEELEEEKRKEIERENQKRREKKKEKEKEEKNNNGEQPEGSEA